jgi:hypothetical protein
MISAEQTTIVIVLKLLILFIRISLRSQTRGIAMIFSDRSFHHIESSLYIIKYSDLVASQDDGFGIDNHSHSRSQYPHDSLCMQGRFRPANPPRRQRRCQQFARSDSRTWRWHLLRQMPARGQSGVVRLARRLRIEAKLVLARRHRIRRLGHRKTQPIDSLKLGFGLTIRAQFHAQSYKGLPCKATRKFWNS